MPDKFLVEFFLPDPITADFEVALNEQRMAVDPMIQEGRIMTYAMADDLTRLWVILVADSEAELVYLINRLPLADRVDWEYFKLAFNQSADLFANISLN